MTETVLVTGGTGYVAGWCVVELLKRGYDVRTTVRSLAKEDSVRTAVASEVDPGERLSFHVADLTSDAGWDTALAGVDYVLHVASPLGDGNPKNPDDLIRPARDGAVRVLRAATEAGVKWVVLTSACAAASPSLYTEDSVTDETLWTDPEDPRLTTYRKSKTLAERAAWDFMASYDGPTTLTTILPGAVFGPVLAPADGGSVMATVLRSSLGESARKVPTRSLPDFALKAMSLFDSSLRDITPALGRKHRHTAAKAEQLLGWHPRPATETVATCGQSLLKMKAPSVRSDR